MFLEMASFLFDLDELKVNSVSVRSVTCLKATFELLREY